MTKIIFLSLILFSSVIFAQAQEKSEAYKFFEYGKIGNKVLKEKFNDYYQKLKKDGDSQGSIINYGTAEKINKREKQLRDSMNFHDAPRITFVRGGNKDKSKTVFWIVPKDAEPPTP